MDSFFSAEWEIPSNQIRIARDTILKSLEVPPENSDPYVESMIDTLILEALSLCAPRAAYALVGNPVFRDKTTLLIRDQSFALDTIVLSALKASMHIAFFVTTAGEKVEQYSKKLLREGHSLEGLIVDLVGSEIAEAGAGFIHQQIGNDMARRDLKITNRYSPGYCGWPVSDQQQLFRILQGHTCGVQLTDSSLMLPIKSVSGIVGVGPDVRNRGYTCAKCDADFCIYRDRR